VVPVDVGSAAQLDIEAEFEINKESLDKIIGNASVVAEAEEFSCEKSGGSTVRGALGPFGFSVLATESLSEQTPVYFYVAKGKDSELKTFFCTDTSRYQCLKITTHYNLCHNTFGYVTHNTFL